MTFLASIWQSFWPAGAVYAAGGSAFGVGLLLACYYRWVYRKASAALPSLKTRNRSLVTETRHLEASNRELEDTKTRLQNTQLALTRSNLEAQQHLAKLVRIADALEHIGQSIQYARRIQEALLPTDHEIKSQFKEAFILNRPRDVVSGDFCWYHRLPDNSLVLVVADCTGHGVPGAFMTVLASELLREIVVGEHITRPDAILQAMDRRLLQTLQRQGDGQRISDGMDAAVCHISVERRELRFAGARSDLCRLRGDGLARLEGSRCSVGGYRRVGQKRFTHRLEVIEPDDRYFLYSDGFQHQIGGDDNKTYKAARLRELLSWMHTLKAEEQLESLEKVHASWAGDNPQTDDILVLGFTIL